MDTGESPLQWIDWREVNPLEPLPTPTRTGPGLRVLVLDEEPPYPLDAGKRIRTWNLLKELAPRHRITYLCYADQHDSAAQRALGETGISLIPVAPRQLETGNWLYARLLTNCFSPRPFSVDKHFRRRFQRAVAGLIDAGHYDLIHCEWTPYAQFAFGLRPSGSGNSVPVLIASHNIEADILRRRAEQQSNSLARRYFQIQAARMERFERSVFARAHTVTAVSENDRRLAQAWGANNAWIVANGVATDFFCRNSQPAESHRNELLFLGSLDWFPNIDAVRYFLAEIFPRVRTLNQEITLSIVGRRPDAALRKLVESVEGASLIGEVPDVRPYLERAAAVVVPLRIGGGTRIKILEAMATGKIVISTSIGAEGLEVEPNVHLLIADNPRDFAAAVSRALDPHQFDGMPDRARRLAEERYSWTSQARELESCWYRTVSQ